MFGKLYASMYEGTLATVGPWQALITFQQLIILSDQHGLVDMTPESIARRTTVPLDIIQIGIEALEKPDPQSRTTDEEGRRIVRLSDSRPWGWRIVNYLHYRNMRTAEDRREYMRNYQREYRKQNKHSVNKCKSNKPMHYASSSSLNSSSENFQKFWNAYPARNGKKLGKGETERLFAALTDEDQELACTAAKNYATSDMAQASIGIKDPKRFLRDGTGNEPWRDWIEPETKTANGHGDLSKKICWKRIPDGDHMRPCKAPVVGIVNGNPFCAEHTIPTTNGVLT
ncbi:MAG: hypothetical protein KC588_02120 [Nitrospira sp.]|nr:hypothetical protein [Nitrospira sp.]